MAWSGVGRVLERDWQTALLFVLTFYVTSLSVFVQGAGNNTLFRMLAQAIVITGLVGMALARHYHVVAEKNDEIHQLELRALKLQHELEKRDLADRPADPSHHLSQGG